MADFVDVREPHTGKLLFRYDAQRAIIEVQSRGVKTVVDLMLYNRDKQETITYAVADSASRPDGLTKP